MCCLDKVYVFNLETALLCFVRFAAMIVECCIDVSHMKLIKRPLTLSKHGRSKKKLHKNKI